MVAYDFSRTSNFRLNYRGNSSQPSVSQLMPVPDNSNPMRISFGNPYLLPSFSHSVTADYRYNNRTTFSMPTTAPSIRCPSTAVCARPSA